MKENKLYTFGTLQKSHSLSSGISFQISPERTCRQSHSSNRGNYTKREIFIIKNNTSRNLKALTSKNNTSTNNEFKLPDIFLKSNSPFKLVKPKEKLLKGQNRLIFEHLKNKKKEERKKIKKIKILSPVKSTQSLSLLSDRLFDFKLERKLIGVTSKNIKLKNSILKIKRSKKEESSIVHIKEKEIKVSSSSIDSDKQNFDNIVFDNINDEKENDKSLIDKKCVTIKKVLCNTSIFKNSTLSTNETLGKLTSLRNILH